MKITGLDITISMNKLNNNLKTKFNIIFWTIKLYHSHLSMKKNPPKGEYLL